ncbi:MAG: xanthine dehydrogenase accessory protein XdhC, partial [Pseudomonadota bacterium]
QLMQRGAHVATLRAADGEARDVLIEPVDKAPLNLIIFGGGHVGRACTEVFATLDANITVVDSRHEYIDHAWPAAVTAMYAQQPEDFVALAPSQAYFLVMTHDHALDLRLCHAILARRDRAFCGLIGSRSKQRRFEKRLRAMGIDDATLATLTCPIGIPTIAGKQPGQIAIATAAQILEHAQAVAASNTAPLRLTAGGNPTRPQG